MAIIERRECERFEIPGTTLVYLLKKGLFGKPEYTHYELPVFDVSYGGVRFLSQDKLKIKSGIAVKIFIPEDDTTMTFEGEIVRVAHHPGQSYKYQIGVQFSPYGEKKGFNPAENLERLKALGKKYSTCRI